MNTTHQAKLRIFIACEDKVAFLRTRQLERQLEALCGSQINISPVYWNFALLRHAGLRECATSEASTADMIIISTHRAEDLPPYVQCWVESLPSRLDKHGALVSLVGADDFLFEPPCIDYLRQIAANRGMDFICNRDDREPVESFDSTFSTFENIPVRGMTPAGMGFK